VDTTVSRDEAIALVRKHIRKENNVKHMIAVGAIMREVALRLGEDPETWEAVGILHDIDFELCRGLEDHTLMARDMLAGVLDGEAIRSIMAHNERMGIPLDTLMKKALVASDAASGLVVASALVMPTKRLEEVRPETLMKKYRDKDFARGADRSRMRVALELGMTLEAFMAAALAGMKRVSGELGL